MARIAGVNIPSNKRVEVATIDLAGDLSSATFRARLIARLAELLNVEEPNG